MVVSALSHFWGTGLIQRGIVGTGIRNAPTCGAGDEHVGVDTRKRIDRFFRTWVTKNPFVIIGGGLEKTGPADS